MLPTSNARFKKWRPGKSKGEPEFNIRAIPMDDKSVFSTVVGKGHTVGVFQLESDGFQSLLKNIVPESGNLTLVRDSLIENLNFIQLTAG